MGTRIYFEYVESSSNWSDGASRAQLDDAFLAKNGLHVVTTDSSGIEAILERLAQGLLLVTGPEERVHA
eukprot:1844688-Lingulodinium_polyedra.AAC.1